MSIPPLCRRDILPLGSIAPTGTRLEVLLTFLKLGLTSFGGPIAHLGCFRAELVERRRWLSEQAYAELVGLGQFLPGPASSQVGFALGWLRAGPWGGLAGLDRVHPAVGRLVSDIRGLGR